MKTITFLLVGAAMLVTSGFAAPARADNATMPAFYDSMLFTINAKEISPTAAASVLANNPTLHELYFSKAMIPGDGMFITVLSAKPGDTFNPLWRRIEIIFNSGVTPRQLFSDNEVTAAANAGMITLRNTGLLFRCAVIGAKPKNVAQKASSSTWGSLRRGYSQ